MKNDGGQSSGTAVVGGDQRVARRRAATGDATGAAPDTGTDESGMGVGRPEATASQAGRGPGRRGWMAAAAVLLVTTVVFAVLWNGDAGTLGSQNDVQAVARRVVLNLTNLTPTTIDTRVNDLEGDATGSFLAQLKQTFGGALPQDLQKAQGQSQGQIRDLGVTSTVTNRATVLAVVDQTYANRSAAAPQTDTLYLQLDLTQTSQGWKVATLTNLSPSTSGVPGGAGSGSAGASSTTTTTGG